MSLFLGLDIGTQGAKGVLIDADRGQSIASASASYGLIANLPIGAAEQHPETWWEAVRSLAAELLGNPEVDAASVAGIGVSGQQHGLVALDGAGRVIRPAKLWCDTSTAREAQELSERIGRLVPTGFTASKLLWIERNEPHHFQRIRSVLLPHDWINFKLSGECWTEAGDASGTGYFDSTNRRYDTTAMDCVSSRLSAWVPPVVAPDRPAAQLSSEAARELGLSAGIPIAPGGGDNMLSAIGSGAIGPDVQVISLGTSATAFAFFADPVTPRERDRAPEIADFCDSTGAWLRLMCVMNATGVLEEVRSAFSPEYDLAGLTRLAGEVAPGSDGLLMLPFLAGERVPDLPNASGSLLGLRAGNLRPGHLFRSALEGIALNIARGLGQMTPPTRAASSEIRLAGGGAKNPLWCEILAATTARPIRRLVHSESAALGAAIQAAWVTTDSSLQNLADAFVELEPHPTRAPDGWTDAYREATRRFGEALATVHGIPGDPQ